MLEEFEWIDLDVFVLSSIKQLFLNLSKFHFGKLQLTTFHLNLTVFFRISKRLIRLLISGTFYTLLCLWWHENIARSVEWITEKHV